MCGNLTTLRLDTYGIFATDSYVWSSVTMSTIFGAGEAAVAGPHGTVPRLANSTAIKSATAAIALRILPSLKAEPGTVKHSGGSSYRGVGDLLRRRQGPR